MSDKDHERMAPDFPLILATVVLALFGLVAIYSASFAIGLERYADPAYFLKRQLQWLFVSVIALLFFMRIPLKALQKLAPLMFFTTFLLLILVLIPDIGVERNNARRWLGVGNMLLQPAELLKLTLTIYFCHLLVKRQAELHVFKRSVLPIVAMMTTCALLILLQPDFSTAVVIILISFVIMFAAGVRWAHIILLVMATLPFVYGLIKFFPYRMRRFMTFLDPWAADGQSDAYQIIHSLYAFGHGGLTGVGFGQSLQKLFYLPEPHTDFIFAIIGEELGLVGAIAVIVVFALFFQRGMRISRLAHDDVTSLLALSLTVLICLQAVINMAITVGLLPVTGLTLPFISYGGSSLLVTMSATGIILNISQYTRQSV